MRGLRAIAPAVLSVVVLAGAAVGAGYAVHVLVEEPGSARSAGPPTVADDPDPSAPSTGVPTEPSAPLPVDPVPAEPTEPEPVLSPGDRGEQVRELQHRLFQLAWWPELTTGRYDPATRQAVRGFQGKRGLERSGVVDRPTWKRLVAMTTTPTRDQRHNVLHPGPAILAAGAESEEVRDLQARLVQIQWLFGDVTGRYDDATVEAVRGFQEKRRIPVTGKVDRRTLDRLVAMTSTPTHEQKHNIAPEPAALDPRCTTGRALCVDKSTNTLSWVIDGTVHQTLEVRFGSDELPTREGSFSVFSKSRDHVSSLYDTPMPLAMFFSGGQAVHYSPDFAANGYAGASHGCVNVRDHAGISWLFDQVRIGDRVVVHWS